MTRYKGDPSLLEDNNTDNNNSGGLNLSNNT